MIFVDIKFWDVLFDLNTVGEITFFDGYAALCTRNLNLLPQMRDFVRAFPKHSDAARNFSNPLAFPFSNKINKKN